MSTRPRSTRRRRASPSPTAAGIRRSRRTRPLTRSDNAFPLKNHGWSAGFSVSYPLFQGGATYFNVKAADASLRGALDSLRSGTNDAALTLAQMFKGMVDAEDNVRIQQELLDATALRLQDCLG